MSIVKICVYGICKNESKNVNKFLSSIKEADIICITDTGSEDNTVDEIYRCAKELNIKDKLTVAHKSFKEGEFDFSEARNFCLDIAKSKCIDKCTLGTDANNWLFISLDFDEYLEEGLIPRMKSDLKLSVSDYDLVMLKGISPRENTSTYIDTKVHKINFTWYRSIHEIVKHNNKKLNELKVYKPEVDYIYYHVQDTSKKRDYYNMLKEAYKKDNTDIKTTTYLCWESALHDDYEDLFNYASKLLYNINNSTNDDFYKDPAYEIQAYKYLSIYYNHKRNYKQRVYNLEQACKIIESGRFPDFRLLHMMLADAYWCNTQKEEAINQYFKVLNITYNINHWVDNKDLYTVNKNAEIYSKLSTAYFYLNKSDENIIEAIKYGLKAQELDKDNPLYKTNLKQIIIGYKNRIIKEYTDFGN